MTTSLSLIVPAYNESARIGRTLQDLLRYLTPGTFDWEIRVVDDGSGDDTAGTVERLALGTR